MYNVFVNGKLLGISKNRHSGFGLVVDYSDWRQLESLVIGLEQGVNDSVLIVSENVKSVIEDFKKFADVREAAGGKITNSKNEILFILRDGVWDLPKGFIEKGESELSAAIRESEEETGVKDLVVDSKIATTFHVYRYKGKPVLKVSHWYDMRSDYGGDLKPQIEEGITLAKWIGQDEINQVLNNTWPNIRLLF